MLKFLIEKEIKQFVRNPFLTKVIFIFPTLILFIMPWVISFDVKNINIVLVDKDRSSVSNELADRIDNSSYFNLVGLTNDYEEAMSLIEYSKADILILIDNNFEVDLVNTGHAQILVEVNSVNSNKGSLGGGYISILTQELSQDLIVDGTIRVPQEMILGAMPKVSISTQYMFNPLLDSKYFMIPALIAIMLVLICALLPALNIVSEKEIGTIEQMNVTPVNKLTFILAKLIIFWIMGLIVMSIGFLVAWLIYGITPVGSFATVYLFAFVFILCVTGMGLTISNFSNTLQQAMFLMMFIIIILILISGLLTPVTSMPTWAQYIAAISPITYYIDAMRAIFLKGSSLRHLMPQMWALVGMAVGLIGLSVASYRKRS